MIRGTTLLAVVVVLGLACVFGQKRLESEKREESKSVLVDIDPDVDVTLDDNGHTDDDDDDSPADQENDPIFGWGRKKGKKYRSRRSRYRRRPSYRVRRPYYTHKPYPHKPYTTQKPHTTAQACTTSRPSSVHWNNNWQGEMSYECPKGHSLTSMKSVFSDCQHDRIWVFGCGYNEASKEHCFWSHGYANDVNEGIFFNCPNNGFVSGIRSIYNNGDRRFRFKCCNDETFDHVDCHQSHHLNLPGQDFEFKVDRDKRFYITGISSYFHCEKRDRVWKIDYCRSEGQVYPEKKDAIEN